MKNSLLIFILGCVFFCSACGTPHAATLKQHHDADNAVKLLQDGDFEKAKAEANSLIAQQPQNTKAYAVRAIANLRSVSYDALALRLDERFHSDHDFVVKKSQELDRILAQIDRDLTRVTQEPSFSLKLCVACWKTGSEHELSYLFSFRRFTVYQNKNGEFYDEDDPRRLPTFRFDIGDVYWIRAFVSFSRARLAFLSGFDSADINFRKLSLVQKGQTFALVSAGGEWNLMRQHLIKGLELSDQARRAYLAETDDELEWRPNPTQQNHPMVRTVDESLYRTWRDVIAELLPLLRGETGLDVAELARLKHPEWKKPPKGYIDLRALLTRKSGIQISETAILRFIFPTLLADGEVEELFQDAYKKQMPASQILSILSQMKREMHTSDVERKLRYLFWLE